MIVVKMNEYIYATTKFIILYATSTEAYNIHTFAKELFTMKTLKQMWHTGLDLRDLADVLEIGIKCATVTGEIALLGAAYLLAVSYDFSPASALTMDALGAVTYHNRNKIGRFFSEHTQILNKAETPKSWLELCVG